MALGEEKLTEYDQDHRALSRQGQERHRPVENPDRAAWRQGAEGPRGAGGAARCRTQDRQCGAERRLRRADHRGGHPHLPRLQPHRPGAGQECAWRWKRSWRRWCRTSTSCHAHHWLILHGRYTCVARKPLCPTCVVRDLCRFKDKTKELPAAKSQGRLTTSSRAKPSGR